MRSICVVDNEKVVMIFSRSGNLSDPNMDPHFLAVLTMIGKNKNAVKPATKDILAKYYAKYRGSSKARTTQRAARHLRRPPN